MKDLRSQNNSKQVSPTAGLMEDVRRLIDETRQRVATNVNAALTLLYWRIGKRINQEVLKGGRAQYGEQIVVSLSQRLVADYGQGFSYSALTRMMKFRQTFPEQKIVVALMQQLSWTHFIALITIDDP